MRPFLPSELKSGNVDSNHVSFDDDESKVVINIDYYNLLLIYSFAYICGNAMCYCPLYGAAAENSRKSISFLPQITVNDSNSNTPAIPFKFDLVFRQTATQVEVFNELAQLVQSALDGYR